MTDTVVTRPTVTCRTNTLGDLIRRKRHALGLTQSQLAAQVNTVGWTIREIECGHEIPTPATRRAIAEVLGLDEAVLAAAPITETPAVAIPRPDGGSFTVNPRPVTDFTTPRSRSDRLIDERPAPIPATTRVTVRSHLVIAPVGDLVQAVNAALDRIQSHRINVLATQYATVHGVAYHPANGGLVAAITYASDVDLFAPSLGVS